MKLQFSLLFIAFVVTVVIGQSFHSKYCTDKTTRHDCSTKNGIQFHMFYKSSGALSVVDENLNENQGESKTDDELPKDLLEDVTEPVRWLTFHTRLLKFLRGPMLGNCDMLVYLEVKTSTFIELDSSVLESCPQLFTLVIQSTQMSSLPEPPKGSKYRPESLVLSGNKIRHLPDDFVNSFENARIIDFSSNVITEIPSDFFKKCQNLLSVSFSENKLRMLPSDLFVKCHVLEEIDLQGNKLEEIPDSLFFPDRPNLRFLHLQNNSIVEFPQHLLSKAYRLEELNLGFNKLPDLPDGFLGSCENLRTLNLENNNLHSFSTKLVDNCNQLYGINLKNNKIISLPEHFPSACPRLSFVELDFNKITNLSSRFLRHCPEIMYISLTGNKLNRLQSSVFEAFPLLRTLKLNKNSLEKLPSEITKNASKLQLLDVSENLLTSFSEYELMVGEISLLESVYNLSFNKLNIIKGGTFRFSNLPTSLDISHNNITELEDGWSIGLQQLKILNLNDNRLQSLDIRDLMLLDNIRILNIANNKLFVIEKYSFVHLSYLTKLDLSQNHINPEQYSSTILPHSLNYLNASHNKLIHFPLSWIRSTTISLLDVSYNQISQNDLVRMMLFLHQKVDEINDQDEIAVYVKGNSIPCPCDIISIAEKHSHLAIKDLNDYPCSKRVQCQIINDCPDTCNCSRNWDDTIFIDCKNSMLTSFPTKTLLNVTMLDISNSNIQDVNNLCHESWNTLTHFVANNAFSIVLSTNTFETKCFQHLHSLSVLDLGNNDISSLPINFLDGLNSLASLNLSRNALHNIPVDMFRNASKLRILDLSVNGISYLDDNIFRDLKSLMKLFLSGNNLRNLSAGIFNQVTNLVELHLERNKIQQIPYDTFKELNHLQVLDLSFNQLNSMFRFPSKLVVLLLASNNFSGVLHLTPSKTWELSSNLTTFDMSNNFISKLIVEIGGFQNIFLNLHLESNQIQQVNIINDTKSVRFERTVIKLYLRDNHVVCDCNISTLVKLAGHKNSEYFLNDKVFVVTDDVVCSRPVFLKGKLLSELRESDLLCEIKSAGCPEACWCYNNKSDKDVIMDCHAEPMTSLPDKIPPNVKILYADGVESISTLSALSSPLYENITELWLKNCCTEMHSFNTSVLNNLHHLERVVFDDNCYCWTNEYIRFHPSGFKGACSYDLPPPLCKKNDQNEWIWRECTSNFIPPTYMYVPMCFVFENCPDNCTCYLTNDREEFVMNCSNLQMTQLPEIHSEQVTTLDMNYNKITNLQGLLQSKWKMLRTLLIRNNMISVISDASLPSQMLSIDLEFNKLQKPSGWLISFFSPESKAITKIKLANNDWKCDCNPPNFDSWSSIKMLQLLEDANLTYCEKNSKKVVLLHSFECPESVEKLPLIIGISFAMCFLFIITAVVTAFLWKGRIIKLWLFTHRCCLCLVKEKHVDDNKEFDAFVSYSSEDAQFVADILMPGLEESEDSCFRYKLCIHERDWLGGEYIPTQIMKSVQVSRRTIIVLSHYFLKSAWANLEFQLALQQAVTDRINRIIVVVPDEVPSKEEMDPDFRVFFTMNSYIHYKQPKFWEKLRYAMPHKTGGKLRKLPDEFIRMVKKDGNLGTKNLNGMTNITEQVLNQTL